MTAKEAIKQLDKIWKSYTSAYDTISEEDVAAYDMAIEALEKQIPKPPKSIKEDYNEYMDLYCPTCGHDVGMYTEETRCSYMDNESNPRMCAKCGQLLFVKLEGEG